MKQSVIFAFLIIPFLFACKDESIDPKEYPLVKTLDAIEIDSTGATFRAEIFSPGNLPITSYGFIWDSKSPDILRSFRKSIRGNTNTTIFEFRIDSNLINSLEYQVRAYVCCDNISVLGNLVKFTSEGSLKSAWSKVKSNFKLEGWFNSFGFANGESGYILFQNAETYSFHPETNEIKREVSFPYSGNSGSYYTIVNIGTIDYLFSNINKEIYKYQDETWIKHATIPFYFEAYKGYYGFAVSDSIYILSTYKSFMYQTTTNIWETKSELTTGGSGYSIAGTNINNKAYLLTTDNNIWEYDITNDSWALKTQYPGILYDNIIAFAFNNKLFFGLSSHDHSEQNGWFDQKLWVYDLAINKWNNTQSFPYDISEGDLFYFFLNDRLYLGYSAGNDNYDLWKFDPSKM